MALTSHLINIFEKVIRNHLADIVETDDLTNPNQYGFRSGQSCLNPLLHHHDKITNILEEGRNVDIIYLDFSNAFDKLDFNITLQKLVSGQKPPTKSPPDKIPTTKKPLGLLKRLLRNMPLMLTCSD